MREGKSEFIIDNLIPSEEVASGAHVPVGEVMFAIPNKADDEEIEEENMNKKALGLTSIPQSTTGGEVLELPGAPQPPGLSRETGDDEETDLFGAEEEGVDFPPEHYKTQKRNDFYEPKDLKEDFLEFLYANKDFNSYNLMKKDLDMKDLLTANTKYYIRSPTSTLTDNFSHQIVN